MIRLQQLTPDERRICVNEQTEVLGMYTKNNGKKHCLIVCPSCGLPRFSDCKCDACAIRELNDALRHILSVDTKNSLFTQYGINVEE